MLKHKKAGTEYSVKWDPGWSWQGGQNITNFQFGAFALELGASKSVCVCSSNSEVLFTGLLSPTGLQTSYKDLPSSVRPQGW